MKEITRRLYTKPVMLGLAFLVGMALVFALFVTQKSSAAFNTFPVAAGNDEFETLADGETFHDFENAKIPANFFGAGSLAYGELVPVEGVPLGPGSNVDTIIERAQAVTQAGGTTPITMTGLSLKSINPITVTYSGGGTEQWNMAVGLSAFKTSTGSMKINFSTFDSTLKVWPKFTFTRVGGGVPPKVWDTGDPGGPGLTAADSASAIGFEAVPAPTVAPAPCPKIIVSEERVIGGSFNSATAAATSSSCPPVTLSSVNQPWGNCVGGGFCIFVPITEEERWARHRPHPKGTKQVVIGE